MIYDCFPFFNENELLEIRLNVLKDVVDRFVLVEAPYDYRRRPKPLLYKPRTDFPITHLVFRGMPRTQGRFDYEFAQRQHLVRGLKGLQDDDIVVLSDLDEIWNPEALKTFSKRDIKHTYAKMRMKHYVYYLNYQISERMHGSVMTTGSYFKTEFNGSMQKLRQYRRHGQMIPHGGWHFSCLYNVQHKILCYSDIEHHFYNWNELSSRLIYKTKRKEITGEFVEIDETYPEYVRNNQKKYEHLIHRHYDDSDTQARADRMYAKRLQRKAF